MWSTFYMSNFDIFNKHSLHRLIEPFATGMSNSITPIKYEAITPDIFAFSFRTTGKDVDGRPQDHFFVSLEFDYIESIQEAKELIENWHGSNVIEFWTPEANKDSDDLRIKVDDVYYALLAEVERRHDSSYWAENRIVLNRDEVEEYISSLDEEYREDVQKSLIQIFNDHSNVSVSVFIHADGKVEYFYG